MDGAEMERIRWGEKIENKYDQTKEEEKRRAEERWRLLHKIKRKAAFETCIFFLSSII